MPPNIPDLSWARELAKRPEKPEGSITAKEFAEMHDPPITVDGAGKKLRTNKDLQSVEGRSREGRVIKYFFPKE